MTAYEGNDFRVHSTGLLCILDIGDGRRQQLSVCTHLWRVTWVTHELIMMGVDLLCKDIPNNPGWECWAWLRQGGGIASDQPNTWNIFIVLLPLRVDKTLKLFSIYNFKTNELPNNVLSQGRFLACKEKGHDYQCHEAITSAIPRKHKVQIPQLKDYYYLISNVGLELEKLNMWTS